MSSAERSVDAVLMSNQDGTTPRLPERIVKKEKLNKRKNFFLICPHTANGVNLAVFFVFFVLFVVKN